MVVGGLWLFSVGGFWVSGFSVFWAYCAGFLRFCFWCRVGIIYISRVSRCLVVLEVLFLGGEFGWVVCFSCEVVLFGFLDSG